MAAIRGALASTIHEVFIYATAIVVVALIASLFLKEVRIGHTPSQNREVLEAETREGAPAFGG